MSDPITDTMSTLEVLNEQVRTSTTLGRSNEAADYADALRNVALAIDILTHGDPD
ncbi:MAG: hypothetical protein ABIW84_07475 [Ilumatobacteraceae bacterium]